MDTFELLAGLRTYLEIALLLAVSLGLLLALERVAERGSLAFSRRRLLQLAYVLAACSVIFPLAAHFVPQGALFKPSAQVWSGEHRRATAADAWVLTAEPATRAAGNAATQDFVLSKGTLLALASLLLMGACGGLLHWGRQVRRLRRFLAAQFQVRRVGRVSLLVSSSAPVPFAAWLPGRSVIVLSASALTDPAALRAAIRHEAQHHRQGDTRAVHLLGLMKALYFWHPALYAWDRLLSRFQEFACDEVLIRGQKVSLQVYGRCLLEAAETAVSSRVQLVGTTGMAAGASGPFLRRRIEMMFRYQKQSMVSSWWLGVIAAGALLGVASVAFASRSAIQGRTVTMAEAQALVNGMTDHEVPIAVNELVLKQLNYYVGTPRGRKFVREARARLPLYQTMIHQWTERYRVPREMIALPFFESGLQNDVVSPPPHRAAGIWQFIPGTAGRYDLVVKGNRDDRTDPQKETVAAMRYLTDLYAQFGDWRLAIKAYNEGEGHVANLIKQHGTEDPWELERKSTTESYLSKAIATMIILEHPSLLD